MPKFGLRQEPANAPHSIPSDGRDASGAFPLGRLRRTSPAAPDEMDVFTIPTLRHTSVEELGTGALPPIHPRLADMLDGVLNARMRVAGDVERSNPGCAMLRGTEGHNRTPRSCLTRAVCSARIRSPMLVRVSGSTGVRSQVDSSRIAAGIRAFTPHPRRASRGCNQPPVVPQTRPSRSTENHS
jgi:hypothetical protein